jgi:hypothetical protein
VLEAAASRTLFPSKSGLSFGALWAPNMPIHMRIRNPYISPKKTIYVRYCSI